MSKTIKSAYKVYNGSDFDTHHFETDTSQVLHTHQDGTSSNLEADLKGALIFIGVTHQEVIIPTMAGGVQGNKMTVKASLLTGTDYFTTVPCEGGRIILNGLSYSNTNKTFSFIPINSSSQSVTNGAFRFSHFCFKRI